MESFIVDFFNKFDFFITYVHIMSVILLIGTLFAIGFLVKPVLYEIKIPRVKYEKSIELVKRFMMFAFICMVLILLSGLTMVVGLDYKGGNPADYVIVHTIEALWIFVGANFIYIYFKYKEASKSFRQNESIQTHENLELIFRYIIPLNFVLGVISVYFGILLGHG